VLLTVLIPAAILGALVLGAILVFQRGMGALDASPRTLLRVYLYLGSLASIIVLVFGLSQTITGALGAVAPDFTYGSTVTPRLMVPCPPNEPGCVQPPPQEVLTQQRLEQDRRTRDSLLQGITMTVAGGLFWLVHWYGRRQVELAAERVSLLARGYFLIGVVIFGVASIVMLPTAIYSSLRHFLVPLGQFDFRPGAGESLAGALVVVPIWLLYLRIVLADFRGSPDSARPAAVEAP
jgi:hypothetical protein